MTQTSIGQRIKIIREEANMNQQEFADAIGIKQPSLSAAESGKSKTISGATQEAICLKFGISREWLASGSGDKKAPQAKPAADGIVQFTAGQLYAMWESAEKEKKKLYDVIERLSITVEKQQALLEKKLKLVS